MLTPSGNDPNRKNELKRKKENPLDWGSQDGPHRPNVPRKPAKPVKGSE